MQEALKTADKKPLVDDHNQARQQQLVKADCQRIFRQNSRNRPTPHEMAHGYIHQRQKQTQRSNQPACELRRFMILQRLPGGGLVLPRSAVFRRCAISGGSDRIANILRCHRRTKGNVHRIRQQADRYFMNARHCRHRFFHMRAACGACHAGDIKFYCRHKYASVSISIFSSAPLLRQRSVDSHSEFLPQHRFPNDPAK